MKALASVLVLSFSFQLTCFGQLDMVLEDISDTLLTSMRCKTDTSIACRFQDHAIGLFMDGKAVEDSVLKNESRKLIGVCLLSLKGFSKEPPTFNLFSLHYRDLREKNFHKRMYVGAGMESVTRFFVTWDFDSEHDILMSAVDTFLYHDQLPIGNGAFEFARSYRAPKEDYLGFCNSNGPSLVIPSSAPVYLRQNGNFIIMLEGEADESTYTEWEDLHATPYFADNLFSITILVIDGTEGTYGDVFKP